MKNFIGGMFTNRMQFIIMAVICLAAVICQVFGWRETADAAPFFFFGMTAQFVFFMRFVVQWIASERRKRSTVPVSFWYLSLVGSLALFVYAFHRWDFVIMSGQALACLIYVRNLMLISDSRKRRRQAGLPTRNARDEVEPTGMAANEPPR